MTVQVANALYRYFEALYELNQNIIILCGVDVLDNQGQYEKQIETVIHLAPRLVPYKYDAENLCKLVNKDGLLEFENDLPFLKTDYEHILQNHKVFLSNIKAIRNKLEHKMHGAQIVATGSGNSCLFDIFYEVNQKRIRITAGELIGFAKELNTLFNKIQILVETFAYEHGKCEYAYYRRLTKFHFCDFNKIYDSGLLRSIGKAFLPF